MVKTIEKIAENIFYLLLAANDLKENNLQSPLNDLVTEEEFNEKFTEYLNLLEQDHVLRKKLGDNKATNRELMLKLVHSSNKNYKISSKINVIQKNIDEKSGKGEKILNHLSKSTKEGEEEWENLTSQFEKMTLEKQINDVNTELQKGRLKEKQYADYFFRKNKISSKNYEIPVAIGIIKNKLERDIHSEIVEKNIAQKEKNTQYIESENRKKKEFLNSLC